MAGWVCRMPADLQHEMRVSIPLQVAPSATPASTSARSRGRRLSTPGSGNGALSVLDGHRATPTLALPSALCGRARHPRHWPAGPRGGRQPNEPRRNKLRDRRDRQPRNPYEAGDIAWSDERQAFFYRTLGECPVPGTILARRNEYTIRSLQRRNRGQRPGLAYICPLLGFPCVLVGVCSGGLGSAQHLRTFGGLSGPVPTVSNQGQPRKQRPLPKKLWDPRRFSRKLAAG
jgi:hypothetical protein